jgi:class 3 adenylate cyclase/tetratricopeptide (TPR) repeat protein
MQCPRCRHENAAGQKFCGECGARLASACASCGTSNPPGQKFCGECGTALGQPAAPARYGTPQSYTPKLLAERIINSKAALEGERKQVTVLFADLKGSMELLADRDPEQARKLLDPVLERMMEAVHHYEGTVNQVMGDGIMALFGAPVAHEDHAVRACYAALRMQESVNRYGAAVQRAAGIPIQIRVGLNSGEVVVRAIGSDLHMDYTAVGQTVHLAARMEQTAMAGSILLSSDTLRLAEGFVEVRPLGPVNVKGLSQAVEVYEATGGGPVRSRLQAAAIRGLTRFVGRDAEVAQLRRALERAGSGHGQLVATVGEPGVGKSRLVHEFVHSHRVHDWLVLQAGSVSYGKATSYLPVVDLLRAYFKVHDREAQRDTREKVMGKLLTLDRALESALPALLGLLDVPTGDPRWEALDPPQRRQRTLDAVKRLLLRESHAQPVLVIFEDLHWIDTETQAFLDSLVESLPTARLLLLVNYRPEYRHDWSSKSYYTQLRLDALPQTSAADLLVALLGADSTVESLRPLLITRTGGNPLFLEESVRALVETGALAGERGAYQLTRSPDTIEVPATVQAILAARIDRLTPEDKRLLQTASVVGKDVPFALLHPIVDLAGEDLHSGLTRLQAAEFLYETRLFPDLEYTFKHALTHEVAYGGLLQGRRRELHARIVEAIESTWPQRLAEQAERLADHALRGEVWDRAFAYGRDAGRKATSRSAYREARAFLEGAQVALARLPDGGQTREWGIDLRLDFQEVFNALGEVSRMLGLLAEAERLAESLADRRRLAQVLAYTSRCFWWMGQPERSIVAGERGLVLATHIDAALEAVVNYHVGLAYVVAGTFRRAIEVFGRIEAALEGPRQHERLGMPALPVVIARTWRGYGLACLGDFADAIDAAEGAVRVAQEADHPYSMVAAVQGLGLVHLVRGDLPRALQCLERSCTEAREGGFAVLVALSGSCLGRTLSLADRPDAHSTLEAAINYSEVIGFKAFWPGWLAWLADAQLHEGRWADAMDTIARSLEFSGAHGQQAQKAEALVVRGAIIGARSTSVPDQARSGLHEALAIATELEMRPLVAHCHLGLGKLCQRADSRQEAQEHFTTATTMYREMGMTYWLEHAEAERHRLD